MLKHIVLLIAIAAVIVGSILLMVVRSGDNEQRIQFELNDIHGNMVTHQDLWGKWSVVTFGFTNCPDVCPTHAARIGAAMYELDKSEPQANSLAKVQAVFISVDYLRDRADDLDRYLKFFHPSYIGYLGGSKQLDQVTESFKVAYQVNKNGDGQVDVLHSSLIYITDPYGRVAKQLPFGSSSQLIVSELQRLMQL